MTNYATIDEAQDYLDGILNTEAWDNAIESKKTKALTMATRAIDNLNFINSKYDADQEQQWPRGLSSTIPDAIKFACAEIALSLLDGADPDIELENLRLIDNDYGQLKTKYNPKDKPEWIVAGIPSIRAWRFLKPYLRVNQNVRIKRVN